MPGIQELLARRKRGQAQQVTSVFVPAPQGGINALSGAGNVPITDALFLYNMIPQEYGVHIRKGYREWCEPIPVGDGIKTIIPFQAANTDAPIDKLFAANGDGIYDITTEGAAPIKVLDWPVKSTRAGWMSWHAYVTIAGNFILACDNENGYYIYTGSTDIWAVGVITGPTPAEALLDFVTVWKNRVWFVQQSTGSAWYLPVGQITGSATEFQFGNKFKYGGFLKSLWNWTLDGGEGVDDYLAVISSGGDFLIYKGEDPATAGEFRQVGSWFIGKPMDGRRQADDFGGDLLALSSYGVIQASKLIAGAPAQDETAQLSYKINPRVNNIIEAGNTGFGWQIKMSPRDQLIFVLTPKLESKAWIQFVYSTVTKAWCQFVDVPMKCCEVYQHKFMFGSDTNRIFVYDGFADNVLLEDSGATAITVQWEMLTGFQTFDNPGINKRVQFMRPRFIGSEPPTFNIAPRYDFNLSQLQSPIELPTLSFGRWNTGIWDTSTWAGDTITTQPPIGAFGIGQHVAIAMRGLSAGGTIYLGTDLMMDSGGYL
jgi:hypothetical protein